MILSLFLLLARYIPNVETTYDMRLTTHRPTDDPPLISKIVNDDISATGHPIYFMFGFHFFYML